MFSEGPFVMSQRAQALDTNSNQNACSALYSSLLPNMQKDEYEARSFYMEVSRREVVNRRLTALRGFVLEI